MMGLPRLRRPETIKTPVWNRGEDHLLRWVVVEDGGKDAGERGSGS